MNKFPSPFSAGDLVAIEISEKRYNSTVYRSFDVPKERTVGILVRCYRAHDDVHVFTVLAGGGKLYRVWQRDVKKIE